MQIKIPEVSMREDELRILPDLELLEERAPINHLLKIRRLQYDVERRPAARNSD